MLPREIGAQPVVLCGAPAECARWRAAHPRAVVSATWARPEAAPSELDMAGAQDGSPGGVAVVLEADEAARERHAMTLRDALPLSWIIVYPTEVEHLTNPLDGDRSQHGKLR